MGDDCLLNMNDPLEAHAVFVLQFHCEECAREIATDFKEKEHSNAWLRRLASRAKEESWYVEPPDAEGRMHAMTAWCHECALRLGFVSNEKEPNQSSQPTSSARG